MFMALLWSTAPLALPGGTSCWHMKDSDRIIQGVQMCGFEVGRQTLCKRDECEVYTL